MRRNLVRWIWKYIPKNVRVYVSRECYIVLWVDRCQRVYAGRCLRFVAPDASAQRQEVMSTIWEGPMRRKDVNAMAGARVHASPGGLADTHPNLAEFLTAAVFSDGGSMESRESPTLTLWCSGGQWRASAKDRAEGLVLFCAAQSWAELILELELSVLEDSAPWRHDEGTLPRKKPK